MKTILTIKINYLLLFNVLLFKMLFFSSFSSAKGIISADKGSIFTSFENKKISTRLDEIGKDLKTYKLDNLKCGEILSEYPEFLSLEIPSPDGNILQIELHKNQAFGKIETGVFTNNEKHDVSYTPGAYYNGKIKGDPKSIVSFSFFSTPVTSFIKRR